jgi:hypothetical protein
MSINKTLVGVYDKMKNLDERKSLKNNIMIAAQNKIESMG